ncbi:MAG: GNAT family N-acetyltransferase [Chloroflexi bacterium]|nr:GNAT family N-acetyltransferase [Chloroflexota bacterium]
MVKNTVAEPDINRHEHYNWERAISLVWRKHNNMSDIQIRPATPDDAEASTELIYMTMGSMANYLLGHDDAAEAKGVISRLFPREKNRYSYQYTDLALINGKIAGLLLAYPGKVMKSLEFPMAESMFAVNELPETLRFFYRSLPLMNIKEVEPDEYFINNVAVFSGFQGHGLGKFLMNLSEQKAKEAGLNKCALTVDVENSRAVGLYEHLGYQIVDTVKVKRLEQRIGFPGLYRMVKILQGN